GYEHDGWGYPFDWQTIQGTIHRGTPLITTVPYVYEAFREVYRLDKDEQWRQVMRSIAQHALLCYRDIETSPRAASCTYTPGPGEDRDTYGRLPLHGSHRPWSRLLRPALVRRATAA